MVTKSSKVLIVDDSQIIREAIAEIIEKDEHLQVIGHAENGIQALKLTEKLKPDLVTMDIIMPEMNGLTALKHLMIRSPVPTIMLSSLTQKAVDVTFDALRYGAIDFIAKPSTLNTENSLKQQSAQIIQKMRLAAKVKAGSIQYIRVKPTAKKGLLQHTQCKKIVALGVAEGGYGALLKIILRLQPDASTAYMVIFYETSAHVDSFIRYLNLYCQVLVKRPENNARLEAGICYMSSGEEYVTVHETGENDLVFHISPAPFLSRRGTIDMLMFSVAEAVGSHALGVILSGDGVDGAEGLEEIIRVGGSAIIQAPVSCLYKSMTLAALNMCEAEIVAADTEIAAHIHAFLPKLNY